MTDKATYPSWIIEAMKGAEIYYRREHGDDWREGLASDWSKAATPAIFSRHDDEMIGCNLHKIRNTFGPSWLFNKWRNS